MSEQREDIKKDLLAIYETLYFSSQYETATKLLSKDILKRLKYRPEKVKETLMLKGSKSEKEKAKIRPEILDLKTRRQVQSYFEQNLLSACRVDIMDEERNNILKSVSTEELKYLYKVVYGMSVVGKCKKIDILYKIKNFFDDEKRTADLFKNLH